MKSLKLGPGYVGGARPRVALAGDVGYLGPSPERLKFVRHGQPPRNGDRTGMHTHAGATTREGNARRKKRKKRTQYSSGSQVDNWTRLIFVDADRSRTKRRFATHHPRTHMASASGRCRAVDATN
jgi:hypothetical protein